MRELLQQLLERATAYMARERDRDMLRRAALENELALMESVLKPRGPLGPRAPYSVGDPQLVRARVSMISVTLQEVSAHVDELLPSLELLDGGLLELLDGLDGLAGGAFDPGDHTEGEHGGAAGLE